MKISFLILTTLVVIFLFPVKTIANPLMVTATTAETQQDSATSDAAVSEPSPEPAESEGLELFGEIPEELPILESIDLTTLQKMQSLFVQTLNELGTWFSDNTQNLLIFAGGSLASVILSAVLTFVLTGVSAKLFRKSRGATGKVLKSSLRLPMFLALTLLGVFTSAAGVLKNIPPESRIIIARIFWAIFSIIIFWMVFRCIAVVDSFLKNFSDRTGKNINDLLISLIRKTLKVAIGAIGIMFIMQNILGLNISTLLAGAGVVGLAIAFAAQNTIANFISSIMVILDRPFVVGDRIKLNGIDGFVEEVGLRSTSVRTLDGNLFTIPNATVADSPIENITKRPYIRYSFDITLTYSMTPQQMRQAVKILHEIMDNMPVFDMATNPPAIHFNEMRDWALVIGVMLWFNCSWDEFLDARESINFAILEKFNEAGLEFAFPTNTSYLIGLDNIQTELLTKNKEQQ